MRDKGIFLDLTPAWLGGVLKKILEPSIVMSPPLPSARASPAVGGQEQYDSLVQRSLRSGVKLAAGSDMCCFYSWKTRGQAAASAVLNMHGTGMPPRDVLRAVTTKAAEMPGWPDRVGSIAPGQFADLVAGCWRSDCGHFRVGARSMRDGGGPSIRNDLAFALRLVEATQHGRGAGINRRPRRK
jgi:hypothetical protein